MKRNYRGSVVYAIKAFLFLALPIITAILYYAFGSLPFFMATPDGYHYPMFGSMLISAGICCWILYRPCGLILRIIFGAVFALGFLGSLVSILRRLIFLHFPGIEAILSVVMCAYGVLGMYLGYSHKYATYLLPFTEDEAAEANKRYSIH